MGKNKIGAYNNFTQRKPNLASRKSHFLLHESLKWVVDKILYDGQK
jgi:hypothetical protein